jgi:hypothetical protein
MQNEFKSMTNLFAFYLGGRAPGANIEVHDTVFVLAADFEEAKLKAKNKWFGNKNRVHIDAYIKLEQIDEWKITVELMTNLFHQEQKITEQSNHLVSNSDSDNDLDLFYINFGSNLPGVFNEFHESGFFVAPSPENAITQARKKLCRNFQNIHVDDKFAVDDCTKVDDLLKNYKIKISHNIGKPSSKAISCYIKL